MHETLSIMGYLWIFSISTGEFTGFLPSTVLFALNP